MNMHQMKNQKGFTLIEIAIVLVIIGLLLGGVLKGQELINTARVRALNNTVDGITAAWYSFQDRYRAYPGDYLDALSKVNLPGGPGGGDGDGIVDTLTTDGDERGRVWVHLEAAGYITGGLSDDSVTLDDDAYDCTPLECPANGFGSGLVITHNTLSSASDVAAHELLTGRGVPVEVLAELDRKVDDGLADTGLMTAGEGADGSGFSTTESGACIGESPVDTDGDPIAGAPYQLLTPSDNCAGVFRNF